MSAVVDFQGMKHTAEFISLKYNNLIYQTGNENTKYGHTFPIIFFFHNPEELKKKKPFKYCLQIV